MTIAKGRRQQSTDYFDSPIFDESWFKQAEIVYPGQITFRLKLDSTVVAWYQKHWPKYRTTISKVLHDYLVKNITLVAGDCIDEPIEVTSKLDPEIVRLLKASNPALANQILRDFMQSCIARGQFL